MFPPGVRIRNALSTEDATQIRPSGPTSGGPNIVAVPPAVAHAAARWVTALAP